jgi:hypothetical protein
VLAAAPLALLHLFSKNLARLFGLHLWHRMKAFWRVALIALAI